MHFWHQVPMESESSLKRLQRLIQHLEMGRIEKRKPCLSCKKWVEFRIGQELKGAGEANDQIQIKKGGRATRLGLHWGRF